MGCWRSTPPTCIQRNKMTWDDDRLSFFSAFLPRGHISTLYFGSRTRIIVWLHHISTKLKMISCWHTTLIGEGKTCNEIGVTAGFKANVITVTPFYQKYYTRRHLNYTREAGVGGIFPSHNLIQRTTYTVIPFVLEKNGIHHHYLLKINDLQYFRHTLIFI